MGTTVTPPALDSYVAHVSSALFAAQAEKPQIQDRQVLAVKVVTGIALVGVIPQGLNVQQSLMGFDPANLLVVNGWWTIDVIPSPIDPAQPMQLAPPKVYAITAGGIAVAVN